MTTTEQLTATGPVVGVRTTRVYCRPDCRPGRDPLPDNCVPFATAESALAAGFRPCRKCRPDEPVASRGCARYGYGQSPVGGVFLAATAEGLCALYLLGEEDPSSALARFRALRLDVEGVAD